MDTGKEMRQGVIRSYQAGIQALIAVKTQSKGNGALKLANAVLMSQDIVIHKDNIAAVWP